MPVFMATENDEIVASSKPKWLILSSIIVVIVIQVSLYCAMTRFQSRKPDFAALYEAGRATIHQRFPLVVKQFPSLNGREYAVETSDGLYPSDTMHPPYEMVIYTFLALFKYRIAYPLWWSCNVVLLFYSTFLLWRHVPNLHSQYPYLLILVGTFFPVLVAFVQGQTSILLLTLLILSYDSLVRQSDFRAGFALSMGMFKFVLVIPIALWLILGKRWRSLTGFVTGSAGLGLLAVWLVGFRGAGTYIQMLAGFGKAAPEKAGTESIMPNLRGLVHSLAAGAVPERLLTFLTLILSLVLMIWVNAQLVKRRDQSVDFSVQVVLATLVSYHLYPHDAAVLVLPLFLLLNNTLDKGIKTPFGISVVCIATCIYLAPFVTPLQVGMLIVCVQLA